MLHDADNSEHTRSSIVGRPEWFAWLKSILSFIFTGKLGQLTVRQETRGEAGSYWYAYRRHGGKMLKCYLGRTSDLTPLIWRRQLFTSQFSLFPLLKRSLEPWVYRKSVAWCKTPGLDFL